MDGIILKFTNIFPEKKLEEPEFYLKGLNKNLAYKCLTSLVGNKVNSNSWSSINYFLSNYFRDRLFSKDIEKRIIDIFLKDTSKTKDIAKYTFIDYYSILKLLETVTLLEENEEEFLNEKIEIKVFYAVLSQNEIRLSKESGMKCDTREKLYLTRVFPDFDLIQKDLKNTFISEAIKSYEFLKFLENSEWKEHIANYLKEINQPNSKEFIKGLLELVIPSIKTKINPNSYSQINVEQDENYKLRIEFLDLFTAKELDPDKDDFNKLRSSPLIKTEEGQYLITYDLFLIELLQKSFFFRIKEYIKVKTGKDLYSDFKKKFSEEVLLYTFFDSILAKWHFKKHGKEFEVEMEGSPDYYAWDGNKIIFIEMKDSILAEPAKQSFDYYKIEEELRKKLFFENKKGVKQLVNNIKRFIDNTDYFDKHPKSSNLSIYPILVVNDFIYNCPGVGNLVQEWFQQEIVVIPNKFKLKDTNKEKIITINPITLINLDTIIANEDILKNRVSLIDSIAAYHNFLNRKMRLRFRDEKEAIEYSGNFMLNTKMTSYDMFFNNTYRDKHENNKIPKRFHEIGLSLFKVD